MTSVVSFGRICVATLAIWLGLAMLDVGPRAMASFCSTLTTTSSVAHETAGQSPFDDNHPPTVWPPHDGLMAAQWLHAPAEQSSSGAGSSTNSSGGNGPVPCLIGDNDQVPPAQSMLLQSSHAISPSKGLLPSIFEPPKSDS